MKHSLSVVLGVLIGLFGYSFFSGHNSLSKVSVTMKESDRVVYSSNVVTLDILNASVRVEFTGDLGADVTGEYSPNERVIRIKCPVSLDSSRYSELFGTIAHESTHFASDIARKKGIKDDETLAYMVGYTTREIIKNIHCN